MSKLYYIVWVGDVEIGYRYLESYEYADDIASDYVHDGYDDVYIEELDNNLKHIRWIKP